MGKNDVRIDDFWGIGYKLGKFRQRDFHVV